MKIRNFLIKVKKSLLSIAVIKSMLVIISSIYLATMQFHVTAVTKYTGTYVGIVMFGSFLFAIILIFVTMTLKARHYDTLIISLATIAIYFGFLIAYLLMSFDGYNEVTNVVSDGKSKSDSLNSIRLAIIIVCCNIFFTTTAYSLFLYHFFTEKPFNINDE